MGDQRWLDPLAIAADQLYAGPEVGKAATVMGKEMPRYYPSSPSFLNKYKEFDLKTAVIWLILVVGS